MKALNSLWKGLIKGQKIIMVVTSMFITLGIATQAAFRYFFSIDFFGFEEVIIIMAFWLYFAGASYGSYEESHIAADIVVTYIKNQKIKKLVVLVVSFVNICISILFTYWSFIYVAWVAKSKTTTSVLKIPVLFSRVPILLGFALMSFYFLAHFIKKVRSFIKEEIHGEGPNIINGGEKQ